MRGNRKVSGAAVAIAVVLALLLTPALVLGLAFIEETYIGTTYIARAMGAMGIDEPFKSFVQWMGWRRF